jgi:uroporphyrinogen decarboxylase
MTPMENFTLLMTGESPAWIPFTLDIGAITGFTAAVQRRFETETGALDPAEYFDYDFRAVSVIRRAGGAGGSGRHPDAPEGTQFDEWGIGHWAGGAEDTYERMYPPLASATTVSEIEMHPEPILDPVQAREDARAFHSRGYPVIGYAGSIYEWSWWLRGMERFMMDLLEEPAIARALIAKVTAFTRKLALESAEAGIDVLAFYDDAGSQWGMQISPDLWRSFIKSAWKSVFGEVRRRFPSVVFFLHSCGNIEAIVPDIAEVGFQILHPIQPECMDQAAFKRQWGNRLVPCATLGAQGALSRSSAESVRRETEWIMDTMGADRRCIVCPSNRVQPETPWENVLAFAKAARSRPFDSRAGQPNLR